MDPSVVSALSAILGSLVGGSAAIATAWITQKTQSKRELVGAEIRKRELLYSEFIAECSKLAIDALDHTLDDTTKLFQVYALHNRIRLVSSDVVVAAADQTIKDILKQYFGSNMTREELQMWLFPELMIRLSHSARRVETSLKHCSSMPPNPAFNADPSGATSPEPASSVNFDVNSCRTELSNCILLRLNPTRRDCRVVQFNPDNFVRGEISYLHHCCFTSPADTTS